jgi:hypothetical protein
VEVLTRKAGGCERLVDREVDGDGTFAFENIGSNLYLRKALPGGVHQNHFSIASYYKISREDETLACVHN